MSLRLSPVSVLRESMTLWLFFLSSLTWQKPVTLAHTAIFENHNSLRNAFKIHYLNQKLVLNRYHNYLSVGKDTKLLEFFLYCHWPFHTRTHECLQVEVRVRGLSCWEQRSHQGPHGLTPDISGHKTNFLLPPAAEFMLSWTPSLLALAGWLKQWRLWAQSLHGS